MPNRLARQTSPYLRQHGDDPVDWYPWGEEAFEAARQSGRPIFLSIGYASCHWCHVMHRESFADAETAARLNDSFVAIKVDRESRPDIDEHYMAYVMASTGHGGWPMSVFLTPDLAPVFGGTYFPPKALHGIPSFADVLNQVSSAFERRRPEVEEAAEEALDYIRAMFAPLPARTLTLSIAQSAARRLLSETDPRHGGFGGAPKFPQAPVTDFLLAYHRQTGDQDALEAAEAAVEGMVRGGIYDQAGGGMARYAVDAAWLVPHFEKMLYDNAQLLTTLASLHRLSPRDEWEFVMRQTAEFLDRDLNVDGAYVSSLDADTAGVEGATYVWSYEELTGVLSNGELTLAEDQLGISPNGNWEGTTILTRQKGRSADSEAVDAVLAKLLRIRRQRPQPGLDDKAIVSWNALAATGLIDAGEAIGDDTLLRRGVSLALRLLDEAVDSEGGVLRLLGDPGSVDVRVLEDAAALCIAAMRASEASGDRALAEEARRIFDRARSSFYDGDGTWYTTPEDTDLPLRPRDQHDSPLPSGPSLAASAALQLSRIFGDESYRLIAEQTARRLVPLTERQPSAAGAALQVILALLA